MRNPPFQQESGNGVPRLYLDDESAGRVAGVSGRTIRTWRANGLPSIKVGAVRRVYLPDLIGWLNAQRVGADQGGDA